MSRYTDFVRYFVVCLVAMFALADGHLFCALCHSTCTADSIEHDCGHSQCPIPEGLPVYCCSDHCDEHPCNTDEFSALIVPRKSNESASPPAVSPIIFASDIFAETPAKLPGVRDAEMCCSSALSLRLHLLYGVLVI